MSLRLILFIIDWLRSLSISIHSSILSNYQSYLFCPFPYIMSIFYPLYTFLFILSILSILPISIHVYFHFHIFCHFLCNPIRFVNSLQSVQLCGWLLSICGPLFVHPYSINVYLWYIIPKSPFWG
jgi:hypothetical protein